jgi:hypothetical protein
MSGTDRRLLAEATMLLGLCRLLLLFVPFRLIASLLSRRPAAPQKPRDPSLNRSVRRAVMTAARNVPWRAVCLPQAMAAKFMLARRGCTSVLHFGLGRNDIGALTAHAWLESRSAIVVGEAGIANVTPIARFG